MKNQETNMPVDLFWTGGWDSTYRLLELLFVEKKTVQPHYVIRPQSCTGKEIDTIHDIERQIRRKSPEVGKLMLPVKFVNIEHVKPDPDIEAENERIKAKQYISVQYQMLARYCKQERLDSVELSVLSSETFEYFKSNTTIFKYFEFPILGLTKPQMAKVSKERGWTEYMNMTWFCRRPRKGKACGICGPCSDAVIAGVGWRLPLRARIIANIQVPFRKYWRNNYDKQNSGAFKKFKDFMERRGMV